ncbi:hypothetical protein ABZQ33_19230 [Pseudomonas aeruginosa]
MANDLFYEDILHNNLIIIADAIPDGEIGAQPLNQSIQDCFSEQGITSYCFYERVRSLQQFRLLFEALLAYAELGALPVIHIEAHGTKGKGLRIGNEIMGWQELYEYSLKINTRTRNNFGVILSCCYGNELSSLVSVDRPCPFRFVIGHKYEINAGPLRDQMLSFYKEIILSGRLDTAVGHLDEGFSHFSSSKYFLINIASFFSKNSSGKSHRLLIEDLLTRVLEGRNASPTSISAIRNRVKYLVKSPEWFITQYMRNFLHGEEPVSFSDLERFYRDVEK